MFVSIFEGIKFIEGSPAKPSIVQIIKPLSVEIGGVFRSAQLKNLDDVKRIMAGEAKKAGGNAIIEFSYGQKSVGFWRSVFDRDDVTWYGAGRIAVIR